MENFYYADQIGCFKNYEEFEKYKNNVVKAIEKMDSIVFKDVSDEYIKQIINMKIRVMENNKDIIKSRLNLKYKELNTKDELILLQYIIKNCLEYDKFIIRRCLGINEQVTNILFKVECCKAIKSSFKFKEIERILNTYIYTNKNFYESYGGKI